MNDRLSPLNVKKDLSSDYESQDIGAFYNSIKFRQLKNDIDMLGCEDRTSLFSYFLEPFSFIAEIEELVEGRLRNNTNE